MKDDDGIKEHQKNHTFQQMRGVYHGKPIQTNLEFLEATNFHIQDVVLQSKLRKERMDKAMKTHDVNLKKEQQKRSTSKATGPIITNKEIVAPNQFIWKTKYNSDFPKSKEDNEMYQIRKINHVPYP